MMSAMAAKRAAWKVLACVGWVAITALLELLALADLALSIIESDSEFVRNPGALIVLAVITAAVCTIALAAAVRGLSSRPGGVGPVGGAALTLAAVAMTLLYAIASIASGPL
jgi:hypothetical protein